MDTKNVEEGYSVNAILAKLLSYIVSYINDQGTIFSFDRFPAISIFEGGG
jgi:hypothetical protein